MFNNYIYEYILASSTHSRLPSTPVPPPHHIYTQIKMLLVLDTAFSFLMHREVNTNVYPYFFSFYTQNIASYIHYPKYILLYTLLYTQPPIHTTVVLCALLEVSWRAFHMST